MVLTRVALAATSEPLGARPWPAALRLKSANG